MPTLFKNPDSPQRSTVLKLKWVGSVIAIATVLTGGWIGGQNWQTRRDYQQGYQAYQEGKCHQAIGNFNKVIQRQSPLQTHDYTASARTKISECQDYLKTVKPQIAGDFPAALLAYNSFVEQYPATDLTQATQKNFTYLLSRKKPATLVNNKVCQQLDRFVTNQLIRDTERHLPPLYRACGDSYASNGDYSNAIEIYEKFRQTYPKHELIVEVEKGLANTLIAEAEDNGATEIVQPPAIGPISFGYTEVQIQNDSPTTLRFVFTGPEQRFSDIEPCTDCEVYQTREQTPIGCPDKGPVQRFQLKPGDYEIAVNSVGDVKTIPFRGKWKLADGVEYGNCFIIVDFPVDSFETEISSSDE